VFLTINKKN